MEWSLEQCGYLGGQGVPGGGEQGQAGEQGGPQQEEQEEQEEEEPADCLGGGQGVQAGGGLAGPGRRRDTWSGGD